MSQEKVPVAAIRRLTIHDGPGVRDTVFVKGCPLHCVWCHNPESISSGPQLLFHTNLCKHCGACVRACYFSALEFCGEKMSAEEVFSKVIRDRDFYAPEGGVTLSGGEPALYPDFASELFEKLKRAGIHTALDTCGAVDFGHYRKILPHTDLVLFDLKGMDPERHRKHTGSDNRLIHENLRKISEFGAAVEIRMPIVPGYNDFPEDIERTGRLLAGIDSLVRVRLLPYHAMAGNKYAAAGMPDTMPDAETPDPERLREIADMLIIFLPREIPVIC